MVIVDHAQTYLRVCELKVGDYSVELEQSLQAETILRGKVRFLFVEPSRYRG